MEGTLFWIEQYQLNQTTGEWYATCNTSGSTLGSTNMGEEWKASYHTMRALMFTEDWIRGSLSTANVPVQVRGNNPRQILVVKRIRGNSFRIENPFSSPCMIDIMTTAGRTVKSCIVNGRAGLLWKAGNAGVYLSALLLLVRTCRPFGAQPLLHNNAHILRTAYNRSPVHFTPAGRFVLFIVPHLSIIMQDALRLCLCRYSCRISTIC